MSVIHKYYYETTVSVRLSRYHVCKVLLHTHVLSTFVHVFFFFCFVFCFIFFAFVLRDVFCSLKKKKKKGIEKKFPTNIVCEAGKMLKLSAWLTLQFLWGDPVHSQSPLLLAWLSWWHVWLYALTGVSRASDCIPWLWSVSGVCNCIPWLWSVESVCILDCGVLRVFDCILWLWSVSGVSDCIPWLWSVESVWLHTLIVECQWSVWLYSLIVECSECLIAYIDCGVLVECLIVLRVFVYLIVECLTVYLDCGVLRVFDCIPWLWSV